MTAEASTRHAVDADGACLGLKLYLWCPGCEELHGPTFRCPEHGGPATGPTWDGDPRARPVTFSPSLLVQGNGVCHSFVRAGRWEFLADSTHPLAGQTVDLVPLPEWARGAND